MDFKLIIDPDAEESVTAVVHARSALTDQIEALILAHRGADRITAYGEEEVKQLPFADISCITVISGKTVAVDHRGQHFRLKQRLYELEQILPGTFIRINKSTLANEDQLERFAATFSGGVDAVFRCGYREYVSRRCFAEIKRRYHL